MGNFGKAPLRRYVAQCVYGMDFASEVPFIPCSRVSSPPRTIGVGFPPTMKLVLANQASSIRVDEPNRSAASESITYH